MIKKGFHCRARLASRVIAIALLIFTSACSSGSEDRISRKPSTARIIWENAKTVPVVVAMTVPIVLLGGLGESTSSNLPPQYSQPAKRFGVGVASFSPDGNQLLLQYAVPKKMGMFAIWDMTTETLFKLPQRPKGRGWLTPSFTPDGTAIVYSDCDPDDLCYIAMMDRNGKFLRRLLPKDQMPRKSLLFPTLSPDGTKVIYQRKNTNIHTVWTGTAYELDIPSGIERKLTPWGFTASRPKFLPDGQNFIFSGGYIGLWKNHDQEFGEAIARYPYGGVDLNEDVAEANWNKRVEEILVRDDAIRKSYKNKYQNNQIFIMGPDYGYDLRPAFAAGKYPRDANISRNGNIVAFTDLVDKPHRPHKSPYARELFIRRDKQNIRLTHMLGSVSGPLISPDGSRILFSQTHHEYKNRKYWLINSDGTGLREIRFPGQLKAKK